MEARITRHGDPTAMTAVAELAVHPARPAGRVLSARKIEHLLDWAEPIIRRTCRDVWRETWPRGLELEDLFQEGRIAVFLAAERISRAMRPGALVTTIVRRQAYDAVRLLADRSGNRHALGPTPTTTGDEGLCETQPAG